MTSRRFADSLIYIMTFCNFAPAFAQQINEQQTKLIQDTAANICDTVKEAKGQKTTVQLQGDISAKVSGLVGKLVDLGGSAKGGLTREEFDGLTQDATASALEGDRGCRERVFNKMFDKLSLSSDMTTAQLQVASAKMIESDLLDAWPHWDDTPKNSVMDVTVVNPTDQIVAVTGAVMNIKKVWVNLTPEKPSYRSVSWNYNVVLPVTGAGCSIPIKDFNQDVPPKGTDRFTITIANDLPGTYDWFIFDVSLKLTYNGTKSIETEPMIFFSPSEETPFLRNSTYERWVNGITRNYATALEIDKSSDSKTPRVQKWVESNKTFFKRTIYEVGNPGTDSNERSEKVKFLMDVAWLLKDGDYNKQVNDLLSSPSEEIRNAATQILNAAASAATGKLDSSFYREDGHTGCSIAGNRPEALTKEEAQEHAKLVTALSEQWPIFMMQDSQKKKKIKMSLFDNFSDRQKDLCGKKTNPKVIRVAVSKHELDVFYQCTDLGGDKSLYSIFYVTIPAPNAPLIGKLER